MSKLSPIGDKLAKLIPLLSSDKEGEVFNAAQAITRLLATVEADWHDLVKAVVPSRSLPVPASSETTSWRTSAAGNEWRRRDGYTITVFKNRKKGGYGICVAGPSGAKTFRDGGYSQRSAMELADEIFEEMVDDL